MAPETPDYLRPAYAAGGLLTALATRENFDKTVTTLQAALLVDQLIQGGKAKQQGSFRGASGDIPEEMPRMLCSFVAGTKVLTPEGERSIEDIKVGDWVLADDPETPGAIEQHQVKHTFVHESELLLDVYVGSEKITTDDEHQFWVKDVGWVAANDLKVGMQLQTNHEGVIGVDRIERREEKQQVYNFEVEGFHTYFVSDLGILVHNSCYTPIDPDTGNPLSLPRNQHGEPIPSSAYSHSQLGWSEGRRGGYNQTRQWGLDGRPVRDIDWTDYGRPQQHTNPHQHRFIENPTGGSLQHGSAEPVDWSNSDDFIF